MKIKHIFILFSSVFLLTGCWDQRELADITVVTGMAVDVGDHAKYKLTIEGINAKELNTRTAGGSAPSIVFSLEGNAISELSHKMNIGLSKHLIFSHMKTLIISEEIGKKGLIDFIDFLERNREIRDDFNFIMAKGTDAANILKVTYQFQKSSSLKLHTQLKTFAEDWGGDPDVRLNDLIGAWMSSGRQPVMAAVSIKGNPKKGVSVDNMNKVTPNALVILNSLAIFEDDKLVGFLTLTDVRNYLWTQNNLKNTSVTVKCGKNKYFPVRVNHSHTKIKSWLQNGQAHIQLSINAEGYLDGTQCKAPLNQASTFEKYEKLTSKKIADMIENTITTVQEKYGIDIFGFGEVAYRQDYKDYKKIGNDWDSYFKDASVSVNVDFHLRRAGIRTNSFLMQMK